MLHACRITVGRALIQDSNAFPSLACTVWNIRHASMQKKDTVALLQHVDKPNGKVAAGKLNTLLLLIPALTPHSQIKEEALPPCKRSFAKTELSQPFSTGKLKLHENAISSETRLREKAQEGNLKQATDKETCPKKVAYRQGKRARRDERTPCLHKPQRESTQENGSSHAYHRK